MSEDMRDPLRENLLLARVVEPLDASARMALRERVMGRVNAMGIRKRTRLAGRRSLVMLALSTTLFSGFAFATAVSLPGDMLHPVKLAVEEARLSVIPASNRPEALADVAGERLDEVGRIIEQQRHERLEEAVAGFGEAATRAVVAPENPMESERVRERIVERVGQEEAPVQNAVGERVPEPVNPEAGDGPAGPEESGATEIGSGTGPEEAPLQEQRQTGTQEESGSPTPNPFQSLKP